MKFITNLRFLFWDGFGPTGLGFICLMILVITGTLLGANTMYERSCHNYEKMTGRKAEWVFLDHCYVTKEDGTVIRYDSNLKE